MLRNTVDDSTTQDNGWHLNKGISISLIVALILQSSYFIWRASELNFRVMDNTESIKNNAILIKEQRDLTSRVIRIEALLDVMVEDLKDVKKNSAKINYLYNEIEEANDR